MIGDSAPSMDRFHIVLVEPLDNLNIGAVARAMHNFGFRNLHLVRPAGFDIQRARITACWADRLLESAQIHADLAQALAGMEDVVGFSGRAGKDRFAHVLLPAWAGEAARSARRTALLFGPEDNGLRKEHVEQCRKLVRIPSSEENPSFNLAQAVLLAVSELYRMPEPRAGGATSDAGLPDWNEFQQLDRLVESVATECGFIWQGTPPAIPGHIKNLFRRTQMDRREMHILMGLFGRIDRTLQMRRGDKGDK